MSNELDESLKKVRDILQNQCNPHCVSVNIFINSEGYEVNYKLRTPKSLELSGISMRNLNGDFITKLAEKL